MNVAAPRLVVRHEQRADGIVAGLRQRKAELGRLLGEKLVRYLHQDAGAVAGARIGADRAAVFEIEQDGQRVFDDFVRFAALDVGNKADPAGILFLRRIKQAESCRRVHHATRAHLLLAFLVRTRKTLVFPAATQFAPAQDCAVLRPGRALQSRRQPLCRCMLSATCRPLAACSCRRPTRPRPGGRPTAQLPLKVERLALCGSPIGTAMLSYTEHGKFRAHVQASIQAPSPKAWRKKAPTGLIRHGFLRCPATQVDHGKHASAMPARAPRKNPGGLFAPEP